jgi:outer membrane protein
MTPRILLILALAAALPTQAYAQRPDDSSRLESLAQDGKVCLSLHAAIELALENNLDIELQRYGPRFAITDIKRTQAGALPRGVPLSIREGPKSASTSGKDPLAPILGPGPETNLSIAGQTPFSNGSLPPSFDPLLLGNFGQSHMSTPQVNPFPVGAPVLVQDITTAGAAFQKGFITGAQLSATFQNSRQKANSLRFDLNPFNTSSFGITITQPLLRGFGPSLNSRFIRIANNNKSQSDLAFKQQVISSVTAVIRLYWDFVSLNENVKVLQQTLVRAQRLQRDNQLKVDQGAGAPIDVVEARAEVSRARRDLIAAQSLVRQQQILLKDYLSRKTVSDPSLAGITIIPTDTLRPDLNERVPTVQSLAERALSERPDIVQARIQLDTSKIALQGSRNALLPSLDLVATLRNNGLAGNVNPLTSLGAAVHTPDSILIGGYGTALSQVLHRNFPDYAIGVQLTLPLRNRAGKADYARDSLALRQQNVRLQQLDKQVHVEIESALISLDQARATLEAAEKEREFEEQSLAAEEEKLAVGASTTFLVIQYQRDLEEALSAEVAAKAGFVKARSGLDIASGALLDTWGISVSDEIAKIK